MLINIMSENDFNFRGSEDIVNKAKDTTLPKAHQTYRKTPFPEQVRIEFRKFGYIRREVGQLKRCG